MACCFSDRISKTHQTTMHVPFQTYVVIKITLQYTFLSDVVHMLLSAIKYGCFVSFERKLD